MFIAFKYKIEISRKKTKKLSPQNSSCCHCHIQTAFYNCTHNQKNSIEKQDWNGSNKTLCNRKIEENQTGY
jgi:hypothetical protein